MNLINMVIIYSLLLLSVQINPAHFIGDTILNKDSKKALSRFRTFLHRMKPACQEHINLFKHTVESIYSDCRTIREEIKALQYSEQRLLIYSCQIQEFLINNLNTCKNNLKTYRGPPNTPEYIKSELINLYKELDSHFKEIISEIKEGPNDFTV